MQSESWSLLLGKKSALISSCGSREWTWIEEEGKTSCRLARAGFSEEAEWGICEGGALVATAIEREHGSVSQQEASQIQ